MRKEKLFKQAPANKPAIVSGRVYSMQNNTPIINYGYTPILGLAALLLLAGCLLGTTKQRSKIK